MNIVNARRALDIANAAQHRHDETITEEKRAAKFSAARIVDEFLGDETVHNLDTTSNVKNPKILDIGGEPWYQTFFGQVDTINLPEDMHDLGPQGPIYDVVIAMHVLEHSPFPLMVLLNIHDILKDSGFMYVAVPRPVEPFNKLPSHFTVLHSDGWEKLFDHAGFGVTFVESGRFGNYDPAVEERFVCIKQR